MRRTPRNVAALLEWFREHRPDDLGVVLALMERDREGDRMATALVGLALQSFEAGRAYQAEHPEIPLGGGFHYIEEEEDREEHRGSTCGPDCGWCGACS